MKARTIISYLPGAKKKPKRAQKKKSFRERFSHYIK
jgi:hypothetical protein